MKIFNNRTKPITINIRGKKIVIPPKELSPSVMIRSFKPFRGIMGGLQFFPEMIQEKHRIENLGFPLYEPPKVTQNKVAPNEEEETIKSETSEEPIEAEEIEEEIPEKKEDFFVDNSYLKTSLIDIALERRLVEKSDLDKMRKAEIIELINTSME